MRKFILLAGSALTVTAAPAVACDLELLGGPQRFNAFVSYASHSVPADASETQAKVASPATSEQQPETVTEVAEMPTDQGADYGSGSPLPSETFR